MMHFILDLEHNIKTYIFFTFLGAAFLQLIYLLFIQARLAFHRIKPIEQKNLPPVSILISARNEADNLYENLPKILNQDYPSFEVIVVNHQSIDESYHILNAYAQQYPQLKIIEVEKSHHLKHGKKLPLTLGIKGAKHEHLLFTDADCEPASNNWLRSMASNFTEKKQIILGFGPHKKDKGFLNKIIRFDTAYIAMNFLSFAKARMPYMGVGRNLAYTKTTFNNVNGYKSHYSLTSGDDDLFIQEAATNNNYKININHDSFCYSKASEDVKSWVKQKERHYTTSGRYKVFNKALLGIYPLTLLILSISFVYLMLDINFRWVSLSVFLGVLLIKWWIQGLCFKKLREPGFILLLPILDILYTFMIPILYYSTNKKDATKW